MGTDRAGGDPTPRAGDGAPYRKTPTQLASDPAFTATYAGLSGTRISPVAPTWPALTMVSTMQTGHGWTASGTTASSNLNDTTDFIIGSQCASVVTNGAGATGGLQKTALGTALDLTGKGLMLWVKVSAASASAVAFISVDVGDDTFTNRYRYVFPIVDKSPLKVNEWCPLFINFASQLGATVSGTPSRSTSTAIRVNAVDAGGGSAITLKIGGLATFPDASTVYPNGVLSLTFDDSYAAHWSTAATKLGTYGWAGTLFPILGRLDSSASYLTTAQVQQMASGLGWEIGAHCTTDTTHADWTTYTAAQIEAELVAMRAWQATNGVQSSTFAWPNGTYTAAMATQAAKHYTYLRSNGTFIDPIGTPQLSRLSSQVIGASVTLAAAKVMVDNAVTAKSWAKFTFHNLVASSASGNDWLISDFNSLVDYIATKSIAVVPLGRVNQPRS